jgi:hypothetical protein
MSNVAMVGKNMDNEPRSTMLSIESKKDLIVQGLVQYYVNLGYKKFVEQFVTHELYNELKVEFVTIKVSVLYNYPYLFKLQSGWLVIVSWFYNMQMFAQVINI